MSDSKLITQRRRTKSGEAAPPPPPPSSDTKKKSPKNKKYNLRSTTKKPDESVRWVDDDTLYDSYKSEEDSTYIEEEDSDEVSDEVSDEASDEASDEDSEEKEVTIVTDEPTRQVHGITVPTNMPVSVKIHLHARIDDEEYDDDEEEEDDDDDEDDEEDEDEDEDNISSELLQQLFGSRLGGSRQPMLIIQGDEENRKGKKGKEEDTPLKLSRKEREYFEDLTKTNRKAITKKMMTISKLINDSDVPYKFRVLEMNTDPKIQSEIIRKIDAMTRMGADSGEAQKLRNWVDGILRVPFGNTINLPVTIKDGPEKCAEFLNDAHAKMEVATYGMTSAKTQIMQVLAQWISNPNSVGNVIAMKGSAGVGKCHAKDTPILMFNGMTKMVQDIEIGDRIMGDDSMPRTVLNLGRGRDMMYDIVPTKGNTYTVNSEHILCLRYSGGNTIAAKPTMSGIHFKTSILDVKTLTRKVKTFTSYEQAKEYLDIESVENNTLEISVKDYLNIPEYHKKQLKGYSVGVDFPSKKVDFDPYIIGLWLGDGTSSKPQITNQDAVILGYLNTTLQRYDSMLVYRSKYDYAIRGYKKNENVFFDVLQSCNLINNKHVPAMYKINDRNVRLQVLAGIIDSDGYLVNNCFEVTQKSKQLADDIVFLSRSLGLATTMRPCVKSCMYKGEKREGTYYRIFISGNTDMIPTKIDRKKAGVRQQVKDALLSHIDVKPVGEGDYYGFTLDGNHRYLLGDFTVTHNTSFARNGIAGVLKRPFMFFSLGGASDVAHYVGHSYTYEGSMWGRIIDSIISAGCMNPVLYFDELDKVSGTPHGEEIMSMLIHLTDRSQNSQYHDRYFAGVDFDLSQCLFVFSFNDESKVHPVLKDRMRVINVPGYKEVEKKVIVANYIWPDILKHAGIAREDLSATEEAAEYIIKEYSDGEEGMRNLIRVVEAVVSRVNLIRISDEAAAKAYKFWIPVKFPMKLERKQVETLLADFSSAMPETWRSLYT
jgi:ATP-dependent Lon protease